MKQILINNEEMQIRVAVVQDGVLQDFFMERTNRDQLVGSIFKGRIKNLEPSLQAAFVDIGSYGLWGEGHTFGSSRVSKEKRAVDIPRHIDLWCKYFKRTPLIISDDIDGNANQSGKYPILDYARSKGVGWRDDSILVEPPPRSWYHADQAERYWRTLPVVLEHEHYAPSKSTKAWSQELLVKSVELMHASYMSIHGDPKKLLDENREAFEKIARRLGCRFVPQRVTWPDMVKIGMGTADLRYRGEFRNWSARFILKYDANGQYSLENIINTINKGGMLNGIGEWRAERDGISGAYHVVTAN